jgi:hypothetical protein
VNYAHVLKDLADFHFAQARIIVLVQDNPNIHSKASLYEDFPAAEARRLIERFDSKARRLARSGGVRARRSVVPVARPANSRRTPLVKEIAAWVHNRNASHIKANWHFQRPMVVSTLTFPGGIQSPPPCRTPDRYTSNLNEPANQ